MYEVKQGEFLSKIALDHGIGDWQAIYNHPENQAFREKRPNPNVIYPGDQIFIPDDAAVPAFRCSLGRTHTFTFGVPRAHLRLRLEPPGGEYKLEVQGETFEGIIPQNRLVQHDIPFRAEQGEITVWPVPGGDDKATWALKVSHLDPVEEVSGIQERLRGLGFYGGPCDGQDSRALRNAIRTFQQVEELLVDGVAGPITQAQLLKQFGV